MSEYPRKIPKKELVSNHDLKALNIKTLRHKTLIFE